MRIDETCPIGNQSAINLQSEINNLQFREHQMPVVFKGKTFSIEVSEITLPNGRTVTAEVVRHPRSVVLIPVPGPGSVILVRQYRFPVNQWLWELPAGSVD